MLSLRSWFNHVVALCRCIAAACFAMANRIVHARDQFSELIRHAIPHRLIRSATESRTDPPWPCLELRRIRAENQYDPKDPKAFVRVEALYGLSEDVPAWRLAE